jgi:hypothetical protein
MLIPTRVFAEEDGRKDEPPLFCLSREGWDPELSKEGILRLRLHDLGVVSIPHTLGDFGFCFFILSMSTFSWPTSSLPLAVSCLLSNINSGNAC